MRCSACGFENPAGFKFCGNCAKPLAPATSPPRDVRSYTPKHLVEKILVSKSALEGERKHVTVLFADVMRSMELAEQVDAEEWHRVLDRFFAILAEGVHRFEGTINQFTGDGIMALFGAPIAHEDHAHRACYAALHLSETLRRYGDEVKRTLGLGFSVRMGINSGEVVVGKIGDDLRMDYTAQGHTVGLAARMEALAGADRIYLAESTAALVGPYFRLRDLGRFEVKGAREPIGVYELGGIGATSTRLEVSRARGFSRFVGREDEMGVLDSALARVLAGEGLVVGICGDAGVGKSRLAHELAERCRARGILVSAGHAQPHGKSVPFLPWIGQLRGYFGITAEDSDETARDKIAGRMLRLDETLVDVLPLAFDFLGVPDPNHPSPPMDPIARQRRLAGVNQRMARARSRREPILFIHEDLHWLDRGSEVLLEALIEIVAETRSLIVVTFRPEYRAAWMEGPSYQEISLRPLGSAEIRQLLVSLIGNDESLADLARRILDRAAGNPFFVEEIVQSLVEEGVLAGPRGAHRLARPVNALEIPANVRAILAARIDRLGEIPKDVLQTAAVIGRDFSEPVLARVTERSADEFRGAVEALVATELVHPLALYPVEEYAFRHPLTQEVAYRSQLAERRARMHRRVAHAIEEAHGGKLDERAALLAHHYEAAGEAAEAAKWHRRAARWLRRSNLAEASVHWRKTLDLLAGVAESPEILKLGLEARTALLQSGWILGISAADAATLYGESRALAERIGDVRAVVVLTAIYAGIQSTHRRIDDYVSVSAEAVRLAERSADPALRATVLPNWARSQLLAGRIREALAIAEQGLAVVPPDPKFGTFLGISPYLNLMQLRGNLLAYAGRWPEAARDFERMIAIAREQTGGALADSGSSDYGWWAAMLGETDTALLHARRGLELAERLGNQLTRVYAYNALGFAELAAGNVEAATAALEQAVQISREVRTGEETVILTLAHLADAMLARRDLPRAREHVEQALRGASEQDLRVSECFVRLVEARVVAASGDGPRIAAALDRSLALAESTGARCFEPFARLERARLGIGDAEAERRRARELFAEMRVSDRVRATAS